MSGWVVVWAVFTAATMAAIRRWVPEPNVLLVMFEGAGIGFLLTVAAQKVYRSFQALRR